MSNAGKAFGFTKLKSGRILNYEICKVNEDTHKYQYEFEEIMLVLIPKKHSTQDWIKTCYYNSEIGSPSFVVAEYIGSDSQSENWIPDLDLTSISDDEIMEILNDLERR